MQLGRGVLVARWPAGCLVETRMHSYGGDFGCGRAAGELLDNIEESVSTTVQVPMSPSISSMLKIKNSVRNFLFRKSERDASG